ncbi:MAG: cobyrinic acid a,c-diamide synthase [Archaeoglobales archaeon]|nr:MAG: cobyrinic acid a,c-diamide synthase [Archaeoglobales archaeon]
MDIPRVIISGVRSRIGKTMISIGLMRALVNRGYRVQPYKVGPDFIDPSFHYFATGRQSRNLDSFMLAKEDLIETFERNFRDADIAVIEGTMGLYDSHNAIDEKGSTAEVSKILKCPVILVADVERMSRTVAPLILGYKLFDPKVRIEGVILNRVGNERHAMKARLAAEKLAKVRVVGVVPRSNIIIPDRHLGLIPAYERKEEFENIFDKLAEFVEKYVDINAIVEAANNAPTLEDVPEHPVFMHKPSDVRIGIVRDRSFNFYYEDNIDALASKAELIFIDSLNDRKLPGVDALYIGGGFPEVFAEKLEKNKSLRKEIYEFCESGRPVYAECGGLMYLGEKLRLIDGSEYEMVGFMPYDTEMHKKFQALGYSIYKAERDCPIARKGDTVFGHEFHYSKVILKEKPNFVFRVERGKGIDGARDGILKENTQANYIHLHVLSYPAMVEKFIKTAKNCKKNR